MDCTLYHIKGIKTYPLIKMLKDVGMSVPKVEKQVQYICSKTGDGGGMYAARQGMRACNNNKMRNPSLHLLL